ncbi:class I SAM-dependent methyltransferase [Halobacteriovorax sp. GB3]|uniref:class I SAM-dependent methyltransferase n=1 Tax=Halobacteriovorax sp. GB3 TaxID=2719615 RepID=UPI00235E233F|nr:class I SAM-dependent methyltransferase [Halobacteriovorax sp. GB3]MDD0852510.1 class I SAM-dependent methyltransferase [Halobacteriovorax sp. GB3]
MQVDALSYTDITELPGQNFTDEQLRMMKMRYFQASKLTEGKDVLEIACGPGLGASHLIKKGAKSYWGGDINPAVVELAKKNNPFSNAHFKELDAHKLSFDDNSFDVILCFEALFYFQDVDKCIAEMKRVLRPGGKALICIPNKEIKGFIGSQYSVAYYNNAELKKIFEKSFSEVQIFGTFKIASDVVKNARFLRIQAAKLMNILPGAKVIKEALKKVLLKKNIELQKNLTIEDEFEEAIDLLDENLVDNDYKLLYCFAG